MEHSSSVVRGNVLVIEEDNDTAETMVVILANAGYGVRRVLSRQAALRVLGTNLYQCIILGIQASEPSLKDFVKELNAVQPYSTVVLLAPAREVESSARSLGLKHCLGKPFDPSVLLNIIEGAR